MPLSQEQLEQVRQTIRQRREQLEAELRSDAARTKEDTFSNLAGPAADPGDESVADLIGHLDSAEMRRDEQEMRQLAAAEGRLKQGTYGMCIDCGRDIPFERLQAQPGALRCIDCQSLHERTHAGPGEPTL
jgi:RNA polymerase-binding protein DksA